MNRFSWSILYLLFSALVLSALMLACADNSSTDSEQDDGYDDPAGDDDEATDDDAVDDDTADDDAAASCDPDLPPIVYMHGFLENGDAFARQTQRFVANGYCTDHIRTFDWNTLLAVAIMGDTVARLDSFVAATLEETGHEQAVLVGHSMGGWLLNRYLAAPERAARVSHAVYFASLKGDIPTHIPALSVTGELDPFSAGTEVDNAVNVEIPNADHLQVSTSEATFEALYSFLHDAPPAVTSPPAQDDILLSGFVQVIGFNHPIAGMWVTIYPVDPVTGLRLSNIPIAQFETAGDGAWGPFQAAPDTCYEFALIDPNGVHPPVRYYRPPFKRSDDKVYFRAFPDSGAMLGQLVGLFPWPTEAAVFGLLLQNQAVIAGRDTLTLNGVDLATEELAPVDNQAIAYFFLDANLNGRSDGGNPEGFFANMIFLALVDARIPTDPSLPLHFEFNGRSLTIPSLAPGAGGLAIAMFD